MSSDNRDTFTVKFVSKLQDTRYIFIGPGSYKTLLAGDEWEEVFVNVPSVQICPTNAVTNKCWTVKIDADKVVSVDH
jgi:hypothetical protein